ncbi:girdin-like [Sesamum indicum]|uniref:Girdin-like n=1 Tax=Sesamum indicum TaxID=4182 RepID=A0A6I9TCR1_SESIN|nr:girdin-like [Sesamum indicum]
MSTASRRTKWHPTPPPPPSPKILHFPRSRRTRRKQSKPTTHHHNNPLLVMHQKYLSYKGKLENLFDQGNKDSPSTLELLEPNSNSKVSAGGGGFEEEKWRFQAEILRAECNFLRMEREFALKKLERNRAKMERTLRSAVQTLVSGRKKIFEGKNVNAVLEEEIEDLAEKLEELQKSSRSKDDEVGNCSNFDKKASVLQRRLDKLGGLSDENSRKELQELAESSWPINNTNHDISIRNGKTGNKSNNGDMLRKKMEALSKGMLERVEQEYGSILTNSSVASSASTSKRIDCPELSSFPTRQFYQESMLHENKCSGRCKAIVRRIVEQVRAETEQWSQMQEMLGQVRGEMEELQASRDFWEIQAHNSEHEIQSLKQAVEEWKEMALGHQNKVDKLQLELSALKEEIQKTKAGLKPSQNREPPLKVNPDAPAPVPLGKQLEKEKLILSCRLKKNRHNDENRCKLDEFNADGNKEQASNKDLPPLSLGKQLAKEKRMLLRCLKESHDASEKGSIVADGRRALYSNSVRIIATERSPLRDIGNSSPLARQHSRSAFPFHSPESSRTRESFRK